MIISFLSVLLSTWMTLAINSTMNAMKQTTTKRVTHEAVLVIPDSLFTRTFADEFHIWLNNCLMLDVPYNAESFFNYDD